MWRIPLSDLNYDHRESEAVQQVFESGWLTMGPRTREFEEKFAALHKAKQAVAVTNCTCALELVYRFILQNADKKQRCIIVPDITFVATANAVISAGGKPILCDVESPDRPYLSPSAVEELLATRMDIAAVVVVHYAGHDAGAEALAQLCARYNVPLIEDCAHAPGATTASGHPLGTIGLAGCFSFFSNKNISTGEGGMIISNSTHDAAATAEPNPLLSWHSWLQMARSHGTSGGGTWKRHVAGTTGYDVLFPGYNYRCTEITAALGIVQLEKLAAGNARRRTLTTLYNDHLNTIEGISVLLPPDNINTSSCHILPVLIQNPDARKRVIDALTDAQIQTSHHYPPIHTFTCFTGNNAATSSTLKNATAFAAQQLTLPLHPKLTNEQVHEITGIIRKAIA